LRFSFYSPPPVPLRAWLNNPDSADIPQHRQPAKRSSDDILRGQGAGESERKYIKAGIGRDSGSRKPGCRGDELSAQVESETQWQGENRGSRRLVAGVEKTRAVSIEVVELEVINWPNKFTGANAGRPLRVMTGFRTDTIKDQ
jgi:hypothetical protein